MKITVPGCLIALIGAQLGVFAFLTLANWQWSGADKPLGALQASYPGINCEDSKFRLLENESGGLFLQDYRYVYEFTVTKQCQSSLWSAARKRGFVEEKGGTILRHLETGYLESFTLDANGGKVRWERDRT